MYQKPEPADPAILITIGDACHLSRIRSKKGKLSVTCKEDSDRSTVLVASIFIIKKKFNVSRMKSFKKHFSKGRCVIQLVVKEPR